MADVKHSVTFDLGTVPSVTVYSCWCNRCNRVIWSSDKPDVPPHVREHNCPTPNTRDSPDQR
jgi:hypothetical protein